jgi:HptB-dependent secretion and biofilm anti anti-sigma factor
MQDSNVIYLPSRFDYDYHKQFSTAYSSIVDDTTIKEIILDFSRVEYLDSSALGMMVMFHKKAAATSKVAKIRGARGVTKEILSMANMQKIFDFM